MEKLELKKLQEFGGLEFLARQVVEGFITGLHKSPLHGFSVEFAEHRQYNSGESTRHIDWKLYARTEKLFVKRYEEETNLRCQIVIDNSSSMHYPDNENQLNKIGFSVYAGASLIHLLRKQRDAVGISVFSNQIETHTPTKSNAAHQRFLYNQLEQLLTKGELNKPTFAIEALHEIAEKMHKRSLVVIFSDMMDSSSKKEDALFSALQHMKHNKHEVILFHVVDKKSELDFNFENRPYTFVDVESGEEVKVHPNRIKETYTQAIKKHTQNLKQRCAQYQIDFVEADINGGFDQVLKAYLIKRQRLH